MRAARGDSNELWRLQLAPPTLMWELVVPSGPRPPAREMHAAARAGANRLVVWGGRFHADGYVYGRTDGLGVGAAARDGAPGDAARKPGAPTYLGDLWELRTAPVVRVVAAGARAARPRAAGAPRPTPR